jgi:hypothetical protein
MSAGGITNERGLRVSVGLSVERQTPKTDFGTVLGRGVSKTTDAVLQAGQLAAPYIPGGAIVSAAVSGLGSVKSSLTSSSAGATAMAPSANVISSGTVSTGGSVATTGTTSSGGSVFGNIEAQAAAGDSSAQMMMATKQMQEMNQSFNLQYLQLQQQMQADNRQFTLLSNIMKTKHDTAKNAINNVR